MVSRGAIDEAVEARQEAMVDLLREFVAVDTENPPGRRYPESAEFLAAAMDERGYDTERLPVPEEIVEEYYPDRTDHDRVNVLGRKGSGSPEVHFTGHFDVVPAGEDWTRSPYEPAVEDGRVYGRGTSDMKSGIVASLFAVEALEAAGGFGGRVTQSMTCDEETGGFTGLGQLVDTGHVAPENTDYCVYTECFGASRVCIGHRGVLKFRVITHGEKAHGCMAHDGHNAITAMTDLLGRMETHREELHGRTTELPVVPEESRHADVSATMVEGGYSENVVPDRCTATFYRVLVPGETVEGARAELQELLAETETATGTAVEYEEIMFAEPTAVPEDGRAAQAYLGEIRARGGDPDVVVSPGSDDQRFVVNDAGIEECIVYGPGLLEQAHVADEYVPIEELLEATKVMAAATADLVGTLDD